MSSLAAPVEGPRTDRHDRATDLVAPFREEYPFAPHFLDVGGDVGLHYVDEGPRDAATLLCVHGNPTWSFYFRRLVRELSDERRVVALDHVGCGLSDKPQDYPYVLEQHVLNLERLVLELDLRDITLCVHDWGGAIGMGFARRHPERIARLIVGNTAAFRSNAMPLRIAACRWPVLGPLFVRGFGAFSRGALSMALELEKRPSAAVRSGYLAPYSTWDDRVATLAFVRDIPMNERHPSWAELVATEEGLAQFADRPTLILWGDRDWCFTPAFREEWQRRFPRATVRVAPDAAHWLLEDAGDRALGWIAEFLAETPD